METYGFDNHDKMQADAGAAVTKRMVVATPSLFSLSATWNNTAGDSMAVASQRCSSLVTRAKFRMFALGVCDNLLYTPG